MKTAVCGVGNRLRGDDGIGSLAIAGLSGSVDSKNVLLLDCQSVPESFVSIIEKFRPKKIILIDTAELQKKPGTVEIVDTGLISGQMMSTHKLPVALFINYLKKKMKKSEIVFVGVQPKNTEFGQRMSPEVRASAGRVKEMVLDLIS